MKNIESTKILRTSQIEPSNPKIYEYQQSLQVRCIKMEDWNSWIGFAENWNWKKIKKFNVIRIIFSHFCDPSIFYVFNVSFTHFHFLFSKYFFLVYWYTKLFCYIFLQLIFNKKVSLKISYPETHYIDKNRYIRGSIEEAFASIAILDAKISGLIPTYPTYLSIYKQWCYLLNHNN